MGVVSVLYYVYVIVVVVVVYVVYVTLQHGRMASPNAASIINNQSINQQSPVLGKLLFKSN